MGAPAAVAKGPANRQGQKDDAAARLRPGNPPTPPGVVITVTREACPPRPEIVITTEQRDVNDAAIEALAAEPDLYHRGGSLVRVVRSAKPRARAGRVRRPEDAPRILGVESATLAEMMAACARWMRHGEENLLPAHPPPWSVSAVLARGCWEGIRYLAGIVEAPALRPDGTVLDSPGYDEATGLLYEPATPFPPMPARPTREDAIAAAARLLDLVIDFPFTGPAHRAAWLAALLTVFARAAILGPVPLFLFEASTAGSGKTLLAELVGLIFAGRDLAVSELANDNEEVRKALTAILLEGDRVVLLDNAGGVFGCPALDAILTSTTFKGRILGRTQRTPELPVSTVFMASGNNLVLKGDTHRRTVPCRLEPAEERPEDRDQFKYPDLKGHVRANRAGYVVDVLTVLKAHAVAGRPMADLPSLGSYEAWCEVVQRAVFWVTGEDPCHARQCILPDHRGDSGTLGGVLAGWAELPDGLLKPGEDAKGVGLTVKQALARLAVPGVNGVRPYETLREALSEWARNGQELPDPEQLGYRLRTARGRVAGGYKLMRRPGADNKPAKWFVVAAGGGDGGMEGG